MESKSEPLSGLTQVDKERDYIIRKGKVLEKFQEKFHERHKHTPLYNHILELLIRDANPYEIIERVLEINDEAHEKLIDIMPFVSPNYHLSKKNNT